MPPAAPHRPLQVALFAGEYSGDVYGAHLTRALRERRPDLTAWGIGGAAMEEAGVAIEFSSRRWGAIGIAEALRVVPRLFTPFVATRDLLAQRLPDLVVLIDFGAFNRHIARMAHDLGLRVFWFVPPGSWSRRGRAGRELLECTDGIATPFPWSETILRDAGANCRFVGHPLLDIVRPETGREEFRRAHGVGPKDRLIAYFPGSRDAEIRYIWPVMAESARALSAEFAGLRHIAGVAASMRDRASQLLDAGVPGLQVTDRTYDLLNAADLAVAKSGTVTLEAAILQCPMLIVYKGSRLATLQARLVYGGRLKWAGMPNILADEGVCPELLGDAATPAAVTEQVAEWLKNPELLESQRTALSGIKKLLGEPGGVDRAAEMALELAGSTR